MSTQTETITETVSGAPAQAKHTRAILIVFAVGLCAVIAAVLVLLLRGGKSADDSALPECNANNIAQFAYDDVYRYYLGYAESTDTVIGIWRENDEGVREKLMEDNALRRFRLCGDQIVYLSARDGNYELCLLPKAGGDNRILAVLPEKEDTTVTEFDLQGNTLYYLYDNILDRFEIDAGTVSTVAPEAFSFAVSDRGVYYSAADGIYLARAGADPVRVSDAANAMGLAMQGKKLYFRNRDGIFRLNDGTGESVTLVVPDGMATSFCVVGNTVYYIRAVSEGEKAALAADMAAKQGIPEADALEMLTNVGHLFRMNGAGGMPTSVGGRYVAAFAMCPGHIYYKSGVFSRVFYEYVED